MDLNNASVQDVAEFLLKTDPSRLGSDAEHRYRQLAQAVVNYRDKSLGGVLSSFDQLQGAVPGQVLAALQQGYFLSDFGVRNVDIVGPQVGKQLQSQARLAVLYSMLGMLVYLAVRFEWIYGVAAVVACLHDTIITVGFFSLLNKEISLTVIAAILTLVGYSMNDTIVVFDRIRENIKLLRREELTDDRQPQHQSDAEPDGADLRADVPDGGVALPVRRRGAQWIQPCSCDRHNHRHVFLDFHSFSHVGGLSELPWQQRKPTGGQERKSISGEEWRSAGRPDGGNTSRQGENQEQDQNECLDERTRRQYFTFLPAGWGF